MLLKNFFDIYRSAVVIIILYVIFISRDLTEESDALHTIQWNTCQMQVEIIFCISCSVRYLLCVLPGPVDVVAPGDYNWKLQRKYRVIHHLTIPPSNVAAMLKRNDR